MSIRDTNNKAKEVIMSCLKELIVDESGHFKVSAELQSALEKQVERVRLALYYK